MYMKKLNITKMCNVISIILMICFILKTIIDYTQYSSTFSSAPFYVWIIANALYFILPAIIVFIVGIIIKMKNKN
jgi:ABC-type arginine transport system permease subunit